MQTKYLILTFAIASSLALSCKKEEAEKPSSKSIKAGDPISVINGKVRFYATLSDSTSFPNTLNLGSDFSGAYLNVNGKNCYLVQDAEGNYHTEVPEAADKVYNAILLNKNSGKWCGEDPVSEVKIPFSQVYRVTRNNVKNCPHFASYSESNGNILSFEDKMAILELKVIGSTSKISSIKVSAPGGEILAGEGHYDFASATFVMDEGLDHAVINCTDGGAGVSVSSSGVSVPIFIAPGEYSKGFLLTICSMDHKMVQKSIPACSIAAGQTLSVDVAWAPSNSLLFYEGFDNCTWGGDVIGGEAALGYAPDDSKVGISSGRQRDGYEDATTRVAYDNPGCGYVQSETWLDCEGKTVGTSHVLSDSYVVSRNFSDWTYLFRCQEYHGVLAAGIGDNKKGIIQLPGLSGLDGMYDVRLTFKLCMQAGATDGLLFKVMKAGHISMAKVDGRAVAIEPGYYLSTGSGEVPVSAFSIPASLAEPKTWHEVEITIKGVSDATRLSMEGADAASSVHGFFIDDIAVSTIAGSKKKGNVRLMYMNIQNGMWADQQNNYDNFVAFVKKYDPDICVWCEAETIYYSGTDTYINTAADCYLPSNWKALASRYGHSNVANGGNRDDYSQEVTSKYSITTVQKITNSNVSGKPISHGAGHFQISVNGRVLNIVTCHTWPMSYALNDSNASGDSYRAFEMDYLVKQTVNNSSYSSQQDWILLGDMNSWSRLDNGVYGLDESSEKFLAQDAVLNNTNLQDVIASWYPAPQFVQSTYGKDRRDYIYMSPNLIKNVVRASTFTDSFTPGTKLGVSNFSQPSDHRPFIIDLNL
ncbi:MAG: endonuclease/exonuclease/phosphatase family protein [Bacteroidales bacterium]|nr:endonuclease/exonuclease/phosphatase family protein [Bacteroidales bacterium]